MTLTGRPARRTSGLGPAAVGHRLARSVLARRLAGVAVLGFVVWRLGVGQSLRAVGAIDARALGAAVVLTALTTLCCAWRWSLVATGLGAHVRLRTAVGDCYRSQFLNTATPGGVLGDLHRGVRHGRRTGDAGRGVRSVVWERTAGQVVQTALALVVLTALPSPVRPAVTWGWAAVAVGLVGTALWHTAGRKSGPGRPPWRTGVVADWCREVRRGVLSRGTWPLVALASALAVTGHVLTFLVAAHTAGSAASATGLVPLAFVVLGASGIPTNLAGWGPREGVAAWVFGAAGLGAGAGLSTAVVYGVLVLVASLPGAVVLMVTRGRRRTRDASTTGTARPQAAATGARAAPAAAPFAAPAAAPFPPPPPHPSPRRSRMADRPYTLLSASMSMDGYLDSATAGRLTLSNAADFDRVDAERADCDAILVGAATIRNDNPRLLVRSAERRAARVARGCPPSPTKVTVTTTADLDRSAEFFAAGEVEKLVYCRTTAVDGARARLDGAATVVDGGDPVALRRVGEDLARRGVGRLMVEGGGSVLTQLLSEDLADELQLVVAPLFVGDSRARRFVGDARFPWSPVHRATLVEVRQIGDIALLRYALSPRFRLTERG